MINIDTIDSIAYDKTIDTNNTLQKNINESKNIDESFSEIKNINNTTMNILENTINKIKHQTEIFNTNDNREIKDEFLIINRNNLSQQEKIIENLAKEQSIEGDYINELYWIIQKYWEIIDLKKIKSLKISQDGYYTDTTNSYLETNITEVESNSKEIIKQLWKGPHILLENLSSDGYQNQEYKNNTNKTTTHTKFSAVSNIIPINLNNLDNLKVNKVTKEVYLDKELMKNERYFTLISTITKEINNGYLESKTDSHIYSEEKDNNYIEQTQFKYQSNFFSSSIISDLKIWKIEQKKDSNWELGILVTISFNHYTQNNE